MTNPTTPHPEGEGLPSTQAPRLTQGLEPVERLRPRVRRQMGQLPSLLIDNHAMS
jgi:hypothetical protein